MSATIPLHIGQRIVQYIPIEAALANANYRVMCNRRGHPKRAFLRDEHFQRLVPLSHSGESFQQHLYSGTVWTLKGTTGSR